MKLLKKITVKGVLERKPTAALLGDANNFAIMTVFGTATSCKPEKHEFGDGNFSEYNRFRGNFSAVRVSDGEEFRSGTLIMPDVAGDALAGVMADLEEGKASVQFAFFIGIKNSESPIGYEYTAEPLTEPQEHDPLLQMRRQLLGDSNTPKLAAPTEGENVTPIDAAKDGGEPPAPEGESAPDTTTAKKTARSKK